jgi:hypothetical protein
MSRDIDEFLLAAESSVPDFDEFADDTYGEPEDRAFDAVAGVHDEQVDREVRHILARIFGM